MQLIGMLDSPYVRRVAISLQCLKLPFEHRPLSVFRTFAEFAAINPAVKAPTLVCDDGTVLMDSTLILQYLEAIAPRGRSLLPADPAALLQALRCIALAVNACEKSVQIYYERELRPADKMHLPWVERASGQLNASYRALEDAWRQRAPAAALDQAAISTAVAWHFTQQMLPDVVPAASHPLLAAHSAAAEERPEFRAAPHGDGTYPVT